jgi:hypothetical protein
MAKTKEPKQSKLLSLAPSRAHRWWECPGRARAEKLALATGDERFVSQEGTAAHRLLELCLKNKVDAERYLEETIVLPRDKMRWEVTEDMVEHIQDCVDLIRGKVGKGKYWSEERIVLRLDGVTQQGNLDASWYGQYVVPDPKTGKPSKRKEWELHVLDEKYGRGALVEAHDNKQLYIYGLAKLHALQKEKKPVDRIHMWIHQPRNIGQDGKPFRHVSLEPHELLDFEIDLRQHVEMASEANAPFNAGPWCLYCAAHATCPTAERANLKIIRSKYRKDDTGRIGELLFLRPQIKHWLAAIDELADAMDKNGSPPIGWVRGTGQRRRKWQGDGRKEAEKAELLVKLLPRIAKEFKLKPDQLIKKQLHGVRKVETMLPKEQRDKLKKFYTWTMSAGRLVPEDSERAAMMASDYFDEVTDDGQME